MCSRFSLGRITRWNLGRCNKHLDNEKGSEQRLVLTMKMKGNGKDWRWIRAGSIFELLRHFEGAATNAKGISCLSRLAPPVHCATLEDRNGVRNLQVGRWMSLGQYGSNRVDADSVFVSGRWINSFELRPHSTISFPSTDVRDDDQHFEKRRRGVGPCWCDIFQTSQTWTKMLDKIIRSSRTCCRQISRIKRQNARAFRVLGWKQQSEAIKEVGVLSKAEIEDIPSSAFNFSLIEQMKRPNINFRVLIIGRANAGKTSILQKFAIPPKVQRSTVTSGCREGASGYVAIASSTTDLTIPLGSTGLHNGG